MNAKACECGCTLLIQLFPQTTNINDYRIWRVGEKVKAEIYSVPVFLCTACGRLDIPYASMQGKNRLDPDVQAYEELYNAVTKYNNKSKEIDKKIKAIESSVSNILAHLQNREESAKTEISNDKEQEKEGLDATKERKDKQQAGRGSKKSTKSSGK